VVEWYEPIHPMSIDDVVTCIGKGTSLNKTVVTKKEGHQRGGQLNLEPIFPSRCGQPSARTHELPD